MATELATSGNQQQLSPLSASSRAISEAEKRLEPLPAKAGNAELLACLTLVAPSGMSAEDRNAWLQVARATLSGIPGDLLRSGCQKARETCRFASEIVPAIVEHTRKSWEWRRKVLDNLTAAEANRNAPRLEQADPEYVTAAEIRTILAEVAAEKRA